MSARALLPILGAGLIVVTPGCGPEDADGPPAIRLGESVCDECGMILSEERFATATIIEGPRGPEPRLFDDFNCQFNYEAVHPDLGVIARWSHDYETSEWLPTNRACFLRSPGLRTPMASQTAAFATEVAANSARDELGGVVMTFEALRQHLVREMD